MLIANEAPGHIAIQHGIKGPNLCIVTACATGAHSIGEACRIIQYGDADAMVAGGSEETRPPHGRGFNAMKALSTRNSDPLKASRPFERDRDGFVVAEGSGIVVLEELDMQKSGGPKYMLRCQGMAIMAMPTISRRHVRMAMVSSGASEWRSRMHSFP